MPPSPNLDGALLNTAADGSVSRATSMMNLTASTLFGIYSPTTTGRGFGGYNDRDEPGTPWGTGAETPAKRLSVDDGGGYEPTKSWSALPRARTAQSTPPSGPPSSRLGLVLSLASRATLLFGLGMGFGVLVSQLQDEPSLAALQVDSAAGAYDWRLLSLWGMAGIVLGTLLPWFDGVWDGTLGPAGRETANADTDWPMVVRSIGAFVGIVFAIVSKPLHPFPQTAVVRLIK